VLAAAVNFTVGAAGADTRIAQAAKTGNLSGVKRLFAARADVNGVEADGSTALLWAAYNDDVEMTKALIGAGAKVDAANRFGVTPLLQAASTGDAAVMEVLLKAGANPNLARPDYENPLMAAARSGSVPAVKLLLARGVDVNRADPFQQETPLMWASAEGHLDVVKTLLEVGGNPNLRAHVTTLTERRAADHPSGGFTALMFAARDGHDAVVEALMKGGADPQLTNGDDTGGLMGVTATIIAIANARYDLAARMIDLGADPNDGSLLFAVDAHDGTTDARARDGSRLRPDHPNTMTSLELIKFLLHKGADPNKQFVGQLHSVGLGPGDFMSASPFYKAAMQSDVEALKIMLARGANVEWVPPQVKAASAGRGGNANWGRPALFVAMTGGRGASFGTAPGFIRQGAPPWREPGSRNPVDAVKTLIAAGADPNVWSWPDNSPALHRAAAIGNIEVIRALVAAGASLDSYDGDGNTPLEIAERNNTPEAIKRVEDAIALANANGNTPPPRGDPPQQVVDVLRELQGLPPVVPKEQHAR
jgi:ankyrin repeat protein